MRRSQNTRKSLYLLLLVVTALSSASFISYHQTAQKPKPSAPHSFVIFSQIRYKNTPSDLSQYGISASVIHSSTSFLNTIQNDPSKTGNSNLDNKIIDATKLTALAQNDLKLNANVPVIIDIESWSFAAAELPNTINSFIKTINIYKATNAISPIGFYGTFPETKYKWSNIKNPSDHQKWKSVNNKLAPVVKLIQFFAPSLYTRDPIIDSANWRSFAKANLDEARRYHVKSPVYAYIQPQYAKTAVFLQAAYWQYQLEQLYEMGYDGVIIWTSNKDSDGKILDFNTATKEDWWQATLNFIKEKKIKSQ